MRTLTFLPEEGNNNFIADLFDSLSDGPITIRCEQSEAVIMSTEKYRRLVMAEFQRICDRIGYAAEKAGLTEEKLAKLLASDE